MYDSIEQIIAEKGIYTGLTRGTSMWPLIHQGRDNIIIVRPRGRLKKYDVPVYRTPGGKYIMHRIVRVRPEDYVIIGDNRLQKEYVTDDSICGVLAGFYKDGKRYVDCQNSRRYRLYSRVWVAHKLYRLIWERFIASQMADALMDTVSVDIDADNCLFKASGSTMKFDGFTVLYEETRDNKGDKDKSENKNLPELHEGDALKLRALDGNQHFTQPPTRYSEASLIKAMEEYGIGRPSTYAPTITTITARNYVEREGKQLKPTVLGEVVTQLMKELFKNIVDVKFTAKMESDLDDVERGEKNWVQSLEQFYGDFSQTLKTAEEKMEGKRVKIPDEETDEVCEVCGKKMVIKIGRFGRFLACSGFPECTNTRKIVQEMPGCCPLCGGKMVLKKSKRGRSFYGCSNFPECNFMTWNIPVAEQCPQCGSTLFQKGGKSGKLICEKPGCGFEKNLTGGGQA